MVNANESAEVDVDTNESAEVDVDMIEVETSSIEVEKVGSEAFHWDSAVQICVKAEIVFCWNPFRDKTRSDRSFRAGNVGGTLPIPADTVEVGQSLST